jgi:dimethylargininase
VTADAFAGFDLVDVHPDEPSAANILRVRDGHLYSGAFPLTLDRVAARGLSVITIDVSEIAKAEGAVTCCSVILEM